MADRYCLQTMLGSKTPKPRQIEDNDTVDDALPEGVDFSEGGWATDFVASLAGALFFISGLYFYDEDRNGDSQEHWLWIHGGTFIAHLFGGLAHRFFPNRASEGVGHYGFYICMMVGYSGNCLRYGFGWDLGESWQIIALGNITYLALSGLLVMCTMTPTTLIVDNVPEGNKIFWSDRLFGLGEAFCSIMEVVACLYYGSILLDEKNNEDEQGEVLTGFIIAAIVANLVGWFAVYFFALLYVLTGRDYDPSVMQRIFHYCMIIMLWGIDSHLQYEREVVNT